MTRISVVGVAGALALLALTAVGATTGAWKLIGISWVAFLSMAAAAWFGARTRQERPRLLVWGYGAASGAMVTSAAVFLVPQAIDHHTQFGGFGVALGLLVGFSAHSISHRLMHLDLPMDRTAAEISAHAFAAGIIIGVVYGNMPELGPLLGLAIVSHKAPAGYAAASRLTRRNLDWSVLLLPAAGVGVAAISASLVQLPAAPAFRAVVFGFSAGVFLHVAMDFLPRCELGSDIHDVLVVNGDAHDLLDRLRLHAVASTAVGGLAVFGAWLLVTAAA